MPYLSRNLFIRFNSYSRKVASDQDEDLKLAKFFNHQKCTLKVAGYDNPINYLTDQGYLAKIQNDLLELQ